MTELVTKSSLRITIRIGSRERDGPITGTPVTAWWVARLRESSATTGLCSKLEGQRSELPQLFHTESPLESMPGNICFSGWTRPA